MSTNQSRRENSRGLIRTIWSLPAEDTDCLRAGRGSGLYGASWILRCRSSWSSWTRDPIRSQCNALARLFLKEDRNINRGKPLMTRPAHKNMRPATRSVTTHNILGEYGPQRQMDELMMLIYNESGPSFWPPNVIIILRSEICGMQNIGMLMTRTPSRVDNLCQGLL